MSLLSTKDEFNNPCRVCQAYDVTKSPCADAACPPNHRKVERTLTLGAETSKYRLCAPIIDGKPSCFNFKTNAEKAFDKRVNTHTLIKGAAIALIGITLVAQYRRL